MTDPRGTHTTDSKYLTDYEVWTDFNTAGLPIRIYGPYNDQSPVAPITRMVWDGNGNLRCSRSPAANALLEKCILGNPPKYPDLADPLNTDYAYQPKAPYKVLTVTAPDVAGQRALTTYHYDEGITGLREELYANLNLAGVPVKERVDEEVDHNWPTGTTHDGLPSTNYSIRWTGYLDILASRVYSFKLDSNDGVRLVVAGSDLLDCFGQVQASVNCGKGAAVKAHLYAGDKTITIEYQQRTDSAHINLWWDQGLGNWAILPTQRLLPNLNLVTSTVGPREDTTTYSYYRDAAHDYRTRSLAVAVTHSATGVPARTTTYDYDDYGRVLTDINAAGTVTNEYAADSTGKACLTQVTDRAGGVTKYDCDLSGEIISTTQEITLKDLQLAQSRVTTNTYDDVGRLWTTSTHDSKTTRTYDHAGRLKTVKVHSLIDSALHPDRTTTYAYDQQGFMTTETQPDPDGPGGPEGLAAPVITHVPDAVGNETRTTDARGKNWIKGYDSKNRVESSKDPYGNETTVAFDDTGQAAGGTAGVPTVTTTDPAAGTTVVTAFDILGRKVSTKVGSHPATTYEYDVAGAVTTVTDPTEVEVVSAYNGFGELRTQTAHTGPNGVTRATTYGYDDAGRLHTVDGPRTDVADVTTYGYDGQGRITLVTPPGLPAGDKWDIDYDAAGERIRVTDPDDRVRDWTYDLMGRLASSRETRDASHIFTTTYHYDGFSELTSVDDPRNIVLHFDYDNLGRKISRFATGGQTADSESFSYDPGGNLTKAVGGTYTVDLVYDDASRLYSVNEGVATKTTYQYGVNGPDGKGNGPRLTSRVDPAGTTKFDYYPSDGRLWHLTDPFTALPTTYEYDDAGRPTTRTDPAGVKVTRTYDPAGRIDLETVKKGDTSLASFDYTLDPAGNVTKDLQTLPQSNPDSGTWDYTYDAMNRLWTATAPDADRTKTVYGYDGAGNRTSVKVGLAGPVISTYDGGGLPVSADDGTTYTHDQVGNLTSVSNSPNANQNWTYAYDSWGRQKSATRSPTNITYAYDALDRLQTRTKVVSGTTTTTYDYVGKGEDPAKTVLGSTATRYAYTLGGPLAQKLNGVVKFYEPNLHGDLAVIVNSSGTVTGTQSYGPYGDKRITTGDTSLFGFQSDPTDPDTAMVDMGARLYDPAQGRFTTRDVLFGDLKIAMSLNQNVYGWDNPVSMTDPDGLCPIIDGQYIPCGPQSPGNAQGAQSTAFTFSFHPQPGFGRVYGGLWIQSATAGAFGLYLTGDARGPSAFANPTRYRIFININYETGKGVIMANPSCYVGGSCKDARKFGNSLISRILGDHNRASAHETFYGLEIKIAVKESARNLPWIPRIDDTINLFSKYGKSDTFHQIGVGVERDGFPSLELYQVTPLHPNPMLLGYWRERSKLDLAGPSEYQEPDAEDPWQVCNPC